MYVLLVFTQWFKGCYSAVTLFKTSKCLQGGRFTLRTKLVWWGLACILGNALASEKLCGFEHVWDLHIDHHQYCFPFIIWRYMELLGCWNELCNSNIQRVWTLDTCLRLRVQTFGDENEDQQTPQNVINMYKTHEHTSYEYHPIK